MGLALDIVKGLPLALSLALRFQDGPRNARKPPPGGFQSPGDDAVECLIPG
jgi:hypothetical protein